MLAGFGRRVGIVDRSRPLPSKGETLAAAGATALRELGAWDAFVRGPHEPCYAFRAIWGSPQVTYFDALRDARGPPWMVDRSALVACLKARAGDLGVVFLDGLALLGLERSNATWRVRVDACGPSLAVRFLIDATGRASAVARRLGARRSIGDRQIALLAASLGSCHGYRPPMLVEAVQGGWWYSAKSPQAGLVLAFFTDRDLIDIRAARERDGFRALLAQSTATHERASTSGRSLAGRPSVVTAASSKLDQVCGEGWIAAGDAAVAYDPLSGHGLSVALVSGRDAASAVEACLLGDRAALARYRQRLARAWKAYEDRRAIQYAGERRWREHPFWQRRSATTQPLDRRDTTLSDAHESRRDTG